MMRRLFFLFCASSALASVRIGIVSDASYIGEREVGHRVKRAAESLGWFAFLDEQGGKQIGRIKNLDWTIHLVPPIRSYQGYHYMAVFHPFGFLDQEKKLSPPYESFDGYLLTIKPEFFNGVFRSETKSFHFVPFYPSAQPTEYKELHLKEIVTTYPVWGNRKRQGRYKTLYRLLSQSGFVKFYGPKDEQGIVQRGYMGQIPYDGVSMIRTLQKHGITLILHSQQHNKQAIPSARIFEAAAASTVIISDENPFVKEHFGDSVYYVDVTLSAEEIFQQISDHREEIFRHPEKALEKAWRAHQIFTERFQMTDQLLAIDKMHREIARQTSAIR